MVAHGSSKRHPGSAPEGTQAHLSGGSESSGTCHREPGDRAPVGKDDKCVWDRLEGGRDPHFLVFVPWCNILLLEFRQDLFQPIKHDSGDRMSL